MRFLRRMEASVRPAHVLIINNDGWIHLFASVSRTYKPLRASENEWDEKTNTRLSVILTTFVPTQCRSCCLTGLPVETRSQQSAVAFTVSEMFPVAFGAGELVLIKSRGPHVCWGNSAAGVDLFLFQCDSEMSQTCSNGVTISDYVHMGPIHWFNIKHVLKINSFFPPLSHHQTTHGLLTLRSAGNWL